MQRLLIYTLLICVFTLPLRAQTTVKVDPARLVEQQAMFRNDIASIKSNIAVQSNEIKNLSKAIGVMNANQKTAIERQERSIDRQNNLILAFIAIPLGIIALITTWRSIRDQTMQKQIDALTRVIEAQTEKNQENN